MNNPEKYRKLVAEIDNAFSKLDEITFAKTQELQYLNAVINETMRVMPIVAEGIGRFATQPAVIDGYEIPANTVVVAGVRTMMKDPEIWPDTEMFIPERWLGNYKGAEADRKAFMPFAGGSRNCIGQQ